MSITFKSLGHLFATCIKAVVTAAKVVVKDGPAVIAEIEKSKVVVDKVLPLVPGIGIEATAIADLCYAFGGDVASVLTTSGEVGKAKLADAGLDISLLHQFEAALKSLGAFNTFISPLLAKK